MPWKCPACGVEIRHQEDLPRPQTIYRCHICRLELVLDPLTSRLIVAPFTRADDPPRRER